MVVAKKHHELYQELGAIVGAKYVSDDYGALLSYTRDMSPFPPGKPQGAVVRPGSVEEVVELVRLANQTRTPLIPMGGKASLSGVPPGQPGRGIIVDMKRMDKVIKIDEANMAVTAQCGITLGELAAKVNEKGWDIPTAWMPIYADTIGGQISGYPGGGLSRYGCSIGGNSHYLLGLKVVLPNGRLVDTGTGEGSINTHRGHTWARGMNGPDPTGMFICDGGMFGIKVEATYRMYRPPKFQKSGVRCWDNLDGAYQALYELHETDPYLYMQPYALTILVGPEVAGIIGVEPAWTLFWLSIANSEEELELKHKNTEAVCVKHGGGAPEPALADLVGSLMLEAAEMGKMSGTGQMPYFEFHVCRRDLLEAYTWGREYLLSLFRERGILSDLSDMSKVKTVALIFPFGTGCGVISLVPFFDQNDRELERTIHELMVKFFEQVRRRGYAIEGSQGYQSRLKASQWTPEFYDYVLTQKKTLDPNNIMNPGVFFP